MSFKITLLFFAAFFSFAALASANSERELRLFVAEQEKLQSTPAGQQEKVKLLRTLEKLSLQAGEFIDRRRREVRGALEDIYREKRERLQEGYNIARKNRLQKLNQWLKNNPEMLEEYRERRQELLGGLWLWFSGRSEALRVELATARDEVIFRFERRYEEMIKLVEKGEEIIKGRP